MKKIICYLASIAIVVGMTACGNSDSSSVESVIYAEQNSSNSEVASSVADITTTTSQSETTTTTTTKQSTTTTTAVTTTTTKETTTTTTATEYVKEPDVSLSISTSKMTEEWDAILIEIIKNEGYSVNYTDDAIELSAPQSVLNKIAVNYKDKINSKCSTPSGEIYSVVINDDYTCVTFNVTDSFEDSTDSFALLLLAQPVYEMQILSGIDKNSVKFIEKVINKDTQKLIKTVNYPEDFFN